MKDFHRLIAKAAKTRGLIKFFAAQHAAPAASCKRIGDDRKAVLKMLNNGEANAAKCVT